MTDTLDRATIEKAYARWAPVYDVVFGKVFERGRRASIAAAERIGGRILEVGVGTGISLPDYARTNSIVGPSSASSEMSSIATMRGLSPPNSVPATLRCLCPEMTVTLMRVW